MYTMQLRGLEFESSWRLYGLILPQIGSAWCISVLGTSGYNKDNWTICFSLVFSSVFFLLNGFIHIHTIYFIRFPFL